MLRALFAGLLLTLAVLAGAGEWFLRAKIVPIDQFWQQVDLFYSTSSVNAAFGDSHIARGFTGRPDMINLAWPGETVQQMKIKIEAFYKNRTPRNVILLATPHMLSVNRMRELQRDYTAIFAEGKRRYRPLGLYILDGFYRRRLIQYVQEERASPGGVTAQMKFLPYGGLMLNQSFSGTLNPVEQLEIQKNMEGYLPAANFRETPYARDYEDIIAFLAARHARVCMVTMPVTDQWRDAIRRAGDQPRMDAGFGFFRDIAAGAHIKYISYWDRLHDPALFFNPSHLNTRGAALMTPVIMQDCFGQ